MLELNEDDDDDFGVKRINGYIDNQLEKYGSKSG
jgi:hypothetical protein